MKMNIYPWQIQDVPREACQDNQELYKLCPEIKELVETKLKLIIKKSHSLELIGKAKNQYVELCQLLKLDPRIRIKTSSDDFYPAINPAQVLERARINARPEEGYSKADQAYLKKKSMNELKAFLERKFKGSSGLVIDLNATSETIQNRLWQSLATERMDDKAIREGDFTTFSPEALKVIKRTKRLFGQRATIATYEKCLLHAGLYKCSLTGEMCNKKTDPTVTVAIFDTIQDYQILTGVATSSLDTKKFQKFIPKKATIARVAEQGCKLLYVNTVSELCRSEEVAYSNEQQAWVIDENPNRWLCISARPNVGLMPYAGQPTPQSERAIAKLGPRLNHRVGFEIEFQSKYTKDMCIRNKDGRPLTPCKVLDEFGWCISPDGSVDGGELKSPVLFFKNTNTVEQIIEQIPTEIADYINRVAKNEKCGGHLNYSHMTYPPANCMMAIGAWGFVWPLMQDVDDRLTNEKLVNRDGYHFCAFKEITNPAHKYQWIRMKQKCMEVRVFPAHWDVGALIWRSRLVSLMMEDVEAKCKKQDRDVGGYHVLNLPGFDNRYMTAMAQQCWNEFQNKENPIRMHLRTFVANDAIVNKMSNLDYKRRVRDVLKIATKTV